MKHKLAVNIPIEFCAVEMFNPKTQRTYMHQLPIMFPDKFAEAIFAVSEPLFAKLFLGDVDAQEYWDHVATRCSWFRNHPANTLDPTSRAKLIPLSLYGDEVQSCRNTEGGVVSVLGWSSDFGHGKPPLSRYFCIGCVCEHYCTPNTHKQILTHVASRISAMCSPNSLHNWTLNGYNFTYSSTQGDLKYVSEKYGLHNYRKNDFCSRCLCKKSDPNPGMTLGNFRLDSSHLATRLDHDAFFELMGVTSSEFNPLFSIPGARLERVLHDVMHSQLLGTGKALNGSVLTFLAERNAFGGWRNGLYRTVMEEVLHIAYADFNKWKSERRINVSQPRFTPSRLSRTVRNSYPSLSSKAAASKAISFWLRDRAATWAMHGDSSLLDKQVAHCIYLYCEVLHILDAAGVLLSEEQGQKLFDNGMQHLQLYADLNAKSAIVRGAHEYNRALWRLFPKHHHFEHLLFDARESLINPSFHTLLRAESFIGIMGRVSRTCHRSSLSLRSLQRYKLLLALHFKSQANLKDLLD